jgi:hypothetical protein
LPANREVAFTVDKEGYGSWIFANVTDQYFPVGERDPGSDDPLGSNTVPLASHEYLAGIAEDLQVAYPWERGMVGLQRWPSLDGVKFMPVGPTVDAVGKAFYLDMPNERYSLELDATTYAPLWFEAPLAQGGFAEVVPGVHQFELTETTDACLISWAWPGDTPSRIRIPVRAGYTTYGSINCTQ